MSLSLQIPLFPGIVLEIWWPVTLDKFPGVMLTGIGETLHRIIGKAVCLATRFDVTLVVAQINCV